MVQEHRVDLTHNVIHCDDTQKLNIPRSPRINTVRIEYPMRAIEILNVLTQVNMWPFLLNR